MTHRDGNADNCYIGQYQLLAETIILESARDYQKAYRKVLKNANDLGAQYQLMTEERWFLGPWAGKLMLCMNITPEQLLHEIRTRTEKGMRARK